MKTVLQMLVNILVVCYMLPAVSRFLIKYQMCHVVIHSVIKKLHHRSFVVLQAIIFVVIPLYISPYIPVKHYCKIVHKIKMF